MALTHQAVCRDAMANAIRTLIHVNSDADSSGSLSLGRTAGFAVGDEVATIFFKVGANAAFGASSGGVIQMDNSPVPEDSDATGHASAVGHFIIASPSSTAANNKTTARTELIRGTVAVSGGDINLSSLTIADGDAVRINSLTWTAPA